MSVSIDEEYFFFSADFDSGACVVWTLVPNSWWAASGSLGFTFHLLELRRRRFRCAALPPVELKLDLRLPAPEVRRAILRFGVRTVLMVRERQSCRLFNTATVGLCVRGGSVDRQERVPRVAGQRCTPVACLGRID